MSHAVVLVIVPEKGDPQAHVERLMAPYDENGEWNREGSKWDWWVVGGRWTGALTDYDPRTDPANIEKCNICGGTGKRLPPPHMGPGIHRCNGCDGKGERVSWRYKPYPGDVQPVSVAREKGFVPYAVLTPDGEWHERAEMGWWGIERTEEKETPDAWKGTVAELLYTYREGHLAVVVDYHV